MLFAVSILYALVLLALTTGLRKLPKPAKTIRRLPFVSIIVAARNEETEIPILLQSLGEQDYPCDRFEIIIADDGSSDDTPARIRKFIASHPKLRTTSFVVSDREKAISPKKNALRQAISRATGEWLLLTDADCRPGPGWISAVARYFSTEIEMVIGFSPLERPCLCTPGHYLLALDSLALAALAAATTGWGAPATCNGRNLAYRKALYERVGGFSRIEKFVSGDDDLFLAQVLLSGGSRIAYADTADAIVPTRLLSGWREFFHQRLRHASKGFHYSPRKIALLAAVYLYNLFLVCAFARAAFGTESFLWPISAWLVKSLGELALLFPFARRMQRLHYLTLYPIAALLHPLYVVLFGALGQIQRFQWKEQNFSKSNNSNGVSN
ncbi:glycosyltransferase [candidate division KSB1 bacterium]|nr:glycosyltransferase [candidate division KSB1 bacterium]